MPDIISTTTPTGWRLRLSYELTSQSIEDNTSTLTLALYLYVATVPSSNVWYLEDNQGYYRTYGDENVTHYQYSYTSIREYQLLAGKTVTVQHNDDGTKTVTLDAEWNRGNTSATAIPQSITLSGAVTLPTIPRSSDLQYTGIICGQNNTLTIVPSITGATHKLEFKLNGQTTWTQIGTGLTNSATLTEAQSKTISESITSATSGTGAYRLTTYSGGNQIAQKEFPVQITIPATSEYLPIFPSSALTDAPYNVGAASSIAAYVQWYSAVRLTVNPAGITLKHGATVAKYRFAYSDKTEEQTAATWTTDVINTTSITMSVTLTDSRGFTATQTRTITLNAYGNPILIDAVTRRDGSAIKAFARWSVSAIYAPGGTTNLNTATVKAFWATATGDYDSGTTLTAATETAIKSDASPYTTYRTKITITDALGNETNYENVIPTDAVAFNIRRGGTAAAFGKYAEEDGLFDNAWDFRNRGDAQIDGDLTAQGSIFAALGVCPAYRTENGALVLRYAAEKILGATDSAGILLIVDKQAQSKFFYGYYALTVGTAENIVEIAAEDVSITASNNQGTVVPGGGSGDYVIAVVPMIKR